MWVTGNLKIRPQVLASGYILLVLCKNSMLGEFLNPNGGTSEHPVIKINISSKVSCESSCESFATITIL